MFYLQDDGCVTYPGEASPLLDALRSVFEALIELDDMAVLALRRCTKEHTAALLYLVSPTVLSVFRDAKKWEIRFWS